MFSALSLAVDMRTRSQDNVLASQPYQFGDSEARLHGEQKQGPVAAPYPSGKIGRPKKGVAQNVCSVRSDSIPAFIRARRTIEEIVMV